ncbi:hypothetical protein PHYSODRAFT_292875 [Phytophthora sojae]|uniref:Uncharacterized protein n=1 Tax=Phytophthora sojae (strain P6497) TaxID=1094619 RepID=G4YGM1_PHYSP|nr:hypothetical protein PHYSODRAFT_292875 [Phytophthora sojae]EGZ26555.1 hypothetical protein PHYSODRAFT_292875 [Phytophthora sojae]|eukprot:XP_009513830.1 hypothetical protein PHYSODRAFT_292875 [Phytophthora sojae]
MPTSKTPAPRVPCPLCGVILAATSIKAHAGRRTCLERRFPELRRQRVLVAQQATKEYDRMYAQKKWEAITILALRVIGTSPAIPLRVRSLADVLPAPPSPPSSTSQAMTTSPISTTSTSTSTESASIRQGPLLSPMCMGVA